MLVITNYLIIKLQILELFVNINWQCVGPVVTYSGKLSLIFNSLCVKGVRIGSFSGPYFPTFGLNTERYSVSPYSIQMQGNTDQKNSEYGHFSCSTCLHKANHFDLPDWHLTHILDLTDNFFGNYVVTIKFICVNTWYAIRHKNLKILKCWSTFTAWNVSKYGVFWSAFPCIWTEYGDLIR